MQVANSPGPPSRRIQQVEAPSSKSGSLAQGSYDLQGANATKSGVLGFSLLGSRSPGVAGSFFYDSAAGGGAVEVTRTATRTAVA